MALTQAKVDRVAYEGTSWTWIADDGKRGLGSGFGLRVYAGRLRFYTIGKARILTLDEARERARELLVRIGDGEDPAADRRRSRDVEPVGRTTTDVRGD